MNSPAASASVFDLYLRKPGRPWHVACRSKAWATAVLTGENMRATYGYEYDVRPSSAVSS